MDASTFDRLTRTLFTHGSRRTALGVLLAGAGTALGLAGQRATAQGCLANDEKCHADDECCSGRCKRKRSGKKVCRPADGQGICTIEQDLCTDGGATTVCGTGSGTATDNCSCFVTAKGRGFCGGSLTAPCECTSNRECEQVAGKGAKCVSAGGVFCPPCGTVCARPCPEPTTPA